MIKKGLSVIFFLLLSAQISYAAHPLITDDAGTVGKGKFEVETIFEQAHLEGGGVRADASVFQLGVTYGVVDNVDIVCTVPYLNVRTREGGIKSTDSGISDLILEAKWRFYEADGLSLAVKPGLYFPSGDENAGLGAGEVGGSFYLIATKEIEPFAFHLNVGYIRNENIVGEGRDVWHVSLAPEWKAFDWMKVVGNIGAEGGRDKETDTPGGFVLGGLIFPIAESMDFDVGLKKILAESAEGYTVLAGITFRF